MSGTVSPPTPHVSRVRRRPLAIALVCALAVLSGCGGHVLPVVRSPEERFEAARRLAREGDLGSAIDLIKPYIDRNAGASDVDAAIYLLGECYLQKKDWGLAQAEFERLLRDYPESDSGGSASCQLGRALYGQARGPDFDPEYTEKALAQWVDYKAHFPGHWRNGEVDGLIAGARDRLARKYLSSGQLYLKLRMAPPARAYFERVLGDYGDLGLAGNAEIGLAICDRLEGHKAEAIERLRRIEAEHAGQPAALVARHERERTEKMKIRGPAKPRGHVVPDIPPPAPSTPGGP